MKKVFYVSYGGGHANISRFIYKELEKDPQVEQEVLALIMADKVFDYSNVPYKYLSQFVSLFSEEERAEILSIGEEIAKTAHNADTTMKYEETVAYMGCGMWDLINRYGKEKAQEMFDKDQRFCFFPITVMRRIFDIVQPDCVVITCEVRMELAAAAVANERGIPVVRVSDCHWIHPIEYDCITCVMNETAREYAINEVGIDPATIRVTGHPVFENNAIVNPEKVKIAKEIFNIPQDKKIILVLPPFPYEKDVLDLIYEFINESEEYFFIVKPHPNDNIDIYHDNYKNAVLIFDYDMAVLLHVCDVLVLTASTAGIEAIFADKPIVIIDNKEIAKYPEWDLSKFNCALKSFTINDLRIQIKGCLELNSEQNKKLSEGRKKFANKEHSAKNIADVVVEEINKRKEKNA